MNMPAIVVTFLLGITVGFVGAGLIDRPLSHPDRFACMVHYAEHMNSSSTSIIAKYCSRYD